MGDFNTLMFAHVTQRQTCSMCTMQQMVMAR